VRPHTPHSPVFVPEGLVFEGINPQGYEFYRHHKSESLCIWIPGGKFPMGANSQDRDARNDEKPLHEITVSGFWMGTTQVSNSQYAKFLAYSGYNTTSDWEEYREKSGDSYPVVMVSLEDAMAFCRWAGGILPSEAQWERAARGFDDRIFPWGSFYDNSRFNCWDSPTTGLRAHFFEEKGPTPGGACPGGDSPFGCSDMAGNVWEWTRDAYDEHYYRNSPDSDPCNDGKKADYVVVRGGSWHVLPKDCRVSRRMRSHFSHTSNDRGFRCAIVPWEIDRVHR
jgi:formylglycine-generating enzyme required for sulfatase activity